MQSLRAGPKIARYKFGTRHSGKHRQLVSDVGRLLAGQRGDPSDRWWSITRRDV